MKILDVSYKSPFRYLPKARYWADCTRSYTTPAYAAQKLPVWIDFFSEPSRWAADHGVQFETYDSNYAAIFTNLGTATAFTKIWGEYYHKYGPIFKSRIPGDTKRCIHMSGDWPPKNYEEFFPHRVEKLRAITDMEPFRHPILMLRNRFARQTQDDRDEAYRFRDLKDAIMAKMLYG